MNFTKSTCNLLVGLILIIGVSQASAENTCKSVFNEKTTSTPSQSVKQVLDHIVGRIEINRSKKSGNFSAKVTQEIDTFSRKRAGSGDELIRLLGSHIESDSPTAVRVEEKAVKSENDLAKLLQTTQSQEFAEKFNENRPLVWAMRDTPPPGHEFLTVTEYGRHFVFKLRSERGKSSVVIKPRFRKYFSYETDRVKDLQAYKSGLGELVAFELKIAGLDGPKDGQFLEVPGVVFKPRIFVTDSIADQIKRLSLQDEKFEEKIAAIQQGILALKSKKGSDLNSPEHVNAMMQAVRWLLAKDNGFFKPQYITTYNRTSYKYGSNAGEYQLTVDRNVGVYQAKPLVTSSEVVSYLAQPPLFASNPGEAFVELKSPVAEKRSQSPLYQALISGVEADHIQSYKMGSGKYAIARRMEDTLFDHHLITTLLEQGTQFWLIKGTANLDAVPKGKDVLNKGEVQVAYPVSSEDGKIYRVVLEYRPLNNLDGTKDAILNKIKIIDQYGSEIKSKDEFDDIIRDSYRREKSEILALDFDGTVVPFRSRITSEELVEYQKFLGHFFDDPSRKLEALSDLKGSKDLHWSQIKNRTSNFKNWVMERTSRGIFGVLFATLGTVTTVAVYGNQPAIQGLQEQKQIFRPAEKTLVDVLPKISFVDSQGNPVHLIATSTEDGGYVFVLPSQDFSLSKDQALLRLFNKNGQSLDFKVRTLDNGSQYLTLK